MRAISTTGKVALAIALLVALFVLGWCATEPGRQKERAAAARAGGILADGRAQAGADAVETVNGAGQRDAATDQQTLENDRAIRQAPGASAPVDPRLDDAGLRALCLRNSYRDAPACRGLR